MFISDYGYQAIRQLRGTRLVLDGPTYANKDYIKALPGARFNKVSKQWSIALPGSNAACSQLCYELAKRGLQWAAK